MLRVKRILPVLAVCLVRLRHAYFRCRRSLAVNTRVQIIAAFDLLMVVFYRVLRIFVRNPGTGQLDVLRRHREAAVLYRRVRRCPSAERVAFQDWLFRYGYRRVRLHLFRCRYLRRSLRHFSRVLVAYFELVQLEVQLQYKATVRRDRSAFNVVSRGIIDILAIFFRRFVRIRYGCSAVRTPIADSSFGCYRRIRLVRILIIVFNGVFCSGIRPPLRVQRSILPDFELGIRSVRCTGSICLRIPARKSVARAGRYLTAHRCRSTHRILLPIRHIRPGTGRCVRFIGKIHFGLVQQHTIYMPFFIS